MKLMDLITESKKKKFGCVMLYFDFPKIQELHNQIDEEDIYNDDKDDFGLEKKPHTTLLYGLHEGITDQHIIDVTNNHHFGTCSLTNVSLFETNPDYDVLKFDVDGDGLHECNSDLRKYPHTNDFPDYHPHLTIGYIKKGKGQKYVDKFKKLTYILIPQHIVYSKIDGNKTEHGINIK